MTPLAQRLSPEQALLLTAALGAEPQAGDAYRRWCQRQDLQELDAASHRILPLLAERLGGVRDDPVADRVRRVVRFTWLRSQLLLTRATPVLAALADAGIPAMLAKGVAVLEHTGWEVQLRPMDDVDIVVPRERAIAAVGVLRACGFEAPGIPADPRETSVYDETHALGFQDGAGAILDLHWHVLHGSLHRDADHGFWEASGAAALREVPVRVLSREDTLLQVVSHGQEFTVFHPVRWIADAVLLLRAAPEAFDWDRVTREAQRHRIRRQVGEAVHVLAAVSPGLVPSAALRELGRPSRAQTAARRSRGLLEARGNGPIAPSRLEAALDDAREWTRRTVAPGRPVTPRHGAGFLRERWALERGRDVPRHALWVLGGRRPGATGLAPGAAQPAGEPVQLPENVGFRVGDAGVPMLRGGWWAPDDHGTWSRGAEAALAMPLAGPQDGPLLLRVDAVPYLTQTRPHLEVDVHAGGALVARWGYSAVGVVEERRYVRLPAAVGRSVVDLRLVFRRPLSPQTARQDADPRPLGIALRCIRVEPLVER